jgi:hypothetical protein
MRLTIRPAWPPVAISTIEGRSVSKSAEKSDPVGWLRLASDDELPLGDVGALLRPRLEQRVVVGSRKADARNDAGADDSAEERERHCANR